MRPSRVRPSRCRIGPAGNQVGFLRPETAQGMFVNFRRLYDYANGRMPMAVAQVRALGDGEE